MQTSDLEGDPLQCMSFAHPFVGGSKAGFRRGFAEES